MIQKIKDAFKYLMIPLSAAAAIIYYLFAKNDKLTQELVSQKQDTKINDNEKEYTRVKITANTAEERFNDLNARYKREQRRTGSGEGDSGPSN